MDPEKVRFTMAGEPMEAGERATAGERALPASCGMEPEEPPRLRAKGDEVAAKWGASERGEATGDPSRSAHVGLSSLCARTASSDANDTPHTPHAGPARGGGGGRTPGGRGRCCMVRA